MAFIVKSALTAVAVGAGLCFAYFWLRGLVDFRAARQQQRWQRTRASWLPFTLDPDSYSGAARSQILAVRRSWRLAMICSLIGAFSAVVSNIMTVDFQDHARLSPQAVGMIRATLAAAAVMGVVVFIGISGRTLLSLAARLWRSLSSGGSGSDDGNESNRPRITCSIWWGFAALAVAAVTILLLIGLATSRH